MRRGREQERERREDRSSRIRKGVSPRSRTLQARLYPLYTLYSVSVSEFPNFFTVTGPGGPFANMLPTIKLQSNLLRSLSKRKKEGATRPLRLMRRLRSSGRRLYRRSQMQRCLIRSNRGFRMTTWKGRSTALSSWQDYRIMSPSSRRKRMRSIRRLFLRNNLLSASKRRQQRVVPCSPISRTISINILTH